MTPNGFFLNLEVHVLPEGKKYCAVDMTLLILCDFINAVTRYTESSGMTRMHAIYSTAMIGVTSKIAKENK